MAGMASALVARLGLRRVLIAGLTLFAGGLVWFAQLPVHGSYVPDVRGPSMPIALGLGFAFVPITILAETGVHDREYGLASGLLNTSQQIGGALGLAVLATLATTRTNHLAASHHPIDQALTLGFHTAFLAAAGFVLLAVVAAATIGTRRTRRHGAPQPTAQPGVDPVLQTPSGLRSEPRLRRADPLGFADLRGPALLVRNRGDVLNSPPPLAGIGPRGSRVPYDATYVSLRVSGGPQSRTSTTEWSLRRGLSARLGCFTRDGQARESDREPLVVHRDPGPGCHSSVTKTVKAG